MGGNWRWRVYKKSPLRSASSNQVAHKKDLTFYHVFILYTRGPTLVRIFFISNNNKPINQDVLNYLMEQNIYTIYLVAVLHIHRFVHPDDITVNIGI